MVHGRFRRLRELSTRRRLFGKESSSSLSSYLSRSLALSLARNTHTRTPTLLPTQRDFRSGKEKAGGRALFRRYGDKEKGRLPQNQVRRYLKKRQTMEGFNPGILEQRFVFFWCL